MVRELSNDTVKDLVFSVFFVLYIQKDEMPLWVEGCLAEWTKA